MAKLKAKVKEALHRYSAFGKIVEVAGKREKGFAIRANLAEKQLDELRARRKQLIEHEATQRQLDDNEQLIWLANHRLKKMTEKRLFWTKRRVWARERHHHWGLVIKHRKDRLRRWIQQHETFQSYMANGNPYEKLTPEAKYGIYLDFRGGNYVTSTYEGYPGDGVHSPGSYHYLENQPDGKARCWDAGAGTLSPMNKAQIREAGRAGPFLIEMFGPENTFEYKNGVRFTLAEGDPLETMHDNHKHTCIRDGAPTK